MVSACSDASLRLHWCHSRARTSASPGMRPRQGKLCKELPISLFSLCCPAPHVPAQQRQRKPHQAANVRHDLPWTANQRDTQEASRRPNCKQHTRPVPATNRQAIGDCREQRCPRAEGGQRGSPRGSSPTTATPGPSRQRATADHPGPPRPRLPSHLLGSRTQSESSPPASAAAISSISNAAPAAAAMTPLPGRAPAPPRPVTMATAPRQPMPEARVAA